ncbi:MAG: GTP-binding protein [Gammaproteobacteria bacterium]|nr:GTP-binding protein [Gammaproteobacteria bacterium]
MKTYKIIFSGPPGAGKSTAIKSVSNGNAVTTEAIATDETAERKKSTTVAMDYSILQLGSGDRIHLYGTPGQERFSFMWDVLTKGGMGLILLIDNKRPDPMADIEFFLDAFKDFIEKTTVVIGITRVDLCATPTIQDHQRRLNEKNLNIPIFAIDSRAEKDIVKLIEALLRQLHTKKRRPSSENNRSTTSATASCVALSHAYPQGEASRPTHS